jgi:hypothetical protein
MYRSCVPDREETGQHGRLHRSLAQCAERLDKTLRRGAR